MRSRSHRNGNHFSGNGCDLGFYAVHFRMPAGFIGNRKIAYAVRRSQVDGPGQFSVRGDIVDIYAPDMHQPARVEYWDDEIDSLASFDLLTQRRDGSLEKIYLSPAREVLFGSTAETAEALRGAIKKARGKKRTASQYTVSCRRAAGTQKICSRCAQNWVRKIQAKHWWQ